MLEVVFSDSTKVAMKLAKNYDKKRMLSGTPGYIGRKPTKAELEKLFEGKAIGGSKQDVVFIGFCLDIGDISGEIDSDGRQNTFYKVWGPDTFSKTEKEQFFNVQREELEKLVTAAAQKTPIRIWKSYAPFSACAFAFVCDALRDADCKISIVSLPEYHKTDDDTIVSYSDWSEIPPGQFYNFLPLEREITNIEKCLQSDHWKELKVENAPLRAIVNGKLISVPEDFYDHIIIKSIPDGEFLLGKLIGKILGKYPLGISDRWYTGRIYKMIEDNKLEIVEVIDSSHSYGKILRKVMK